MTVAPTETRAIRAVVTGTVQGVGFREATTRRARELGITGWVRNDPDGGVQIHAEGPDPAIGALLEFLDHGPPAAQVAQVVVQRTAPEHHEQFAIRGIAAGVFVVQEHRASAHHFDLRLDVAGLMRSWAVPKGPSLDPAVKRLAIEVADHAVSRNAHEEPGRVIVWDHGSYEQGGRVPWPQALDRGHAVFVLNGAKLRGGFALQRTRPDRAPQQWLLIKRRDEHARPGSDIVAERPESPLSGATLADR